MRNALLVAFTIALVSIPAAAATQSEEPFLRPRVSRNQTRPTANQPRNVTANLAQDPGPGPGNGGAGSCQTDRVCSKKEGNSCKAWTGLTCYEWPSGDGIQQCGAC